MTEEMEKKVMNRKEKRYKNGLTLCGPQFSLLQRSANVGNICRTLRTELCLDHAVAEQRTNVQRRVFQVLAAGKQPLTEGLRPIDHRQGVVYVAVFGGQNGGQ